MSVTWTTKDGKKIPISKMETHHIINALELMKRKTAILCDELKKRIDRGYTTKEIDEKFRKVVNQNIRDLKDDMRP